MIGSNTVIFDLTKMTENNIEKYEQFFEESIKKIKQIKISEFEKLDQESKSECEGLRKMFQMLSEINLKQLK